MNYRRLFDENMPFARFLNRAVDLCALDLLWVLLCVPVVTAGAATCALYSAIGCLRRDEPGVYRCFFRAFRQDLRQATALWLLLAAAGAGLVASFWLTSGWAGPAAVAVRAALCVPMALLVLAAAYGFPLLARFQVTLGGLLTDAVMLGIAYFPRTLLLVFIDLLPVLAVYFLSSILTAMLFIWVPIGFSLTALAALKCLDPIMARLEADRTAGGRT